MSVRLAGMSFALVFAVSACSKSPTQPSATVSTPVLVLPANGAQVRNMDQPVTLVVQNAAVSGGSGATTYLFEVATDSGFVTKVFTRDGVAQGTSGQTSLTLNTLTANQDYYWHARAQSAGTAGAFGTTNKFTIGPAITIDAPTPVSPLSGATVTAWPTFVVNNAAHTGAVGSLVYRFDVASDGSFLATVLSGTVPETSGQTRFVPGIPSAPPQGTLYWHAIVIDQGNSVSSAASAAQSFTVSSSGGGGGQPLWSGEQPPGTNGQAVQGDNWNTETRSSPVCGPHVKPTLDELRVFDLIDKGFEPQAGIDWMHANGYSTDAAWFADRLTIGFQCEYIARRVGTNIWDLVSRVGG